MKPDLTMYRGRKVIGLDVSGTDPADWAIELEGGIKVANVSANETIAPTPEIIGSTLETVLLSYRDTTLVFRAANGHTHKLSFAPTYYTIMDPGYGGIVYPQWPEELEEGGVPATPEGGISEQPQAGWVKAEAEHEARAVARRQAEATEFLKEEDGDTA
jgi:hypothetical protein